MTTLKEMLDTIPQNAVEHPFKNNNAWLVGMQFKQWYKLRLYNKLRRIKLWIKRKPSEPC